VLEAEVNSLDRKRDLNCYDHYLRALALIHQDTPTSLAEAYQEARKAIATDARFGPAYMQAPFSFFLLKFRHAQQIKEMEAAQIIPLTTTALELASEDELVVARAALVFAVVGREFERGLALAGRAIALNNNLTNAWNAKGWCALFLGQFSEALEAFAKALRLNPVHTFSSMGPLEGQAATCWMMGRYDDAILWADKLLAVRPNDLLSLTLAYDAGMQTGRLDEARLYASRVQAIYPHLRSSHLKQIWCCFRRPEDIAKVDKLISLLGLPD
jgi:tetratricopeptide (TPR) repeat protein